MWRVVHQIVSGAFPGLLDSGFVVLLVFVYAILAIDLIGLCVSPLFSVPKIQATIALIDLGAVCEAKFSYFGQKFWDLGTMFYGRSSAGHVNLDRLLTDLIVILAALLLVSLDAVLDTHV